MRTHLSEVERSELKDHIESRAGSELKLFNIFDLDTSLHLHVLEPSATRPYYTFITVGLCAKTEESPIKERAELMFMLPVDWELDMMHLVRGLWKWPFTMMQMVASMPGVTGARIGFGTLLKADDYFDYDTELCAVMMMESDQIDGGLASCFLSSGKCIRFYQLLPLYCEEYDYAVQYGSYRLFKLMIKAEIPLVINPERAHIDLPQVDLQPDESESDESDLSEDELLDLDEPEEVRVLRPYSQEPTPSRVQAAYYYSKRAIATIASHIEQNFGVPSWVDEDLDGKYVKVDINVIAPTEDKPYYFLVTSGLGAFHMIIPNSCPKQELNRAEFVMVLPPDWRFDAESLRDDRWYWPLRILRACAYITASKAVLMYEGFIYDADSNLADNTQLCGCMLVPADCDPTIASLGAGECKLSLGKKVNFYLLAPLYNDEIYFVDKHGPAQLLREVVEHGLVVDLHRPHLLHQVSHHPISHHPNTNKIKRHPSKRGKKQGGHKGHARPKRY